MADNFEIHLEHAASPGIFQAQLISFGYSYKIVVDVYGVAITFERDDDSNFRAIVANPPPAQLAAVDQRIVELIAVELQHMFED